MPVTNPEPRKLVIHVVFHDGWKLREEGSGPGLSVFATREAAIADAKARAKGAAVTHLIVHKPDDTIESEATYP